MDAENQLTDGGVFPHSDCGEACILSVLTDSGRRVPIRSIEQACAAAGADLAQGTTADEIVRVFRAFGVVANWWQGIAPDSITTAIANSERAGAERWLIEINSDSWGNPGRGHYHWVLTDGRVVMNPIGARLVANLPAYCAAATGDVVEVMTPVGGSVSVAGGGTDMAAGFWQGLALMADGASVFRSREGEGSPPVNATAIDATALAQSQGGALIDVMHALMGSREHADKCAALNWLGANLAAVQAAAARPVNPAPRADVVVAPSPPTPAAPAAPTPRPEDPQGGPQ